MRISDWSSDVCSSDLSVSDDLAAIIVRRNSIMNTAIPAFRGRMPNVDRGTRERPPIHPGHSTAQLHRSVVLILVAHWKAVRDDSRILQIIRTFQRRLRASHQFALDFNDRRV